MQSMTRSVSLNFNARKTANEPIESNFDSETISLKQFCFPHRSYGTCDFFPSYVPSSNSSRHRKCISHVVADNETLAGIALKYDISVEEIRRTNSFLWTTNSVWVGQIIKVPVIHPDKGDSQHSAKESRRKSAESSKNQPPHVNKIGPTTKEFWSKVDHSIEASKKVTHQFAKTSSVEGEPSVDFKY